MSGAWLDAGDAALNAVVGDTLARRGSPLAITMSLFDRGRSVDQLPPGAAHLVVLVHGMACTERCWTFPDRPDVDYGRLLARDLGLTPIYVRYNTGLPIHENGRALDALFDALLANASTPIEDITLIGHSLGGLVIRSACHYGAERAWTERVRQAFYVGSPHRGSPVARAGHTLATALGAIDEPVVRAIAEVVELRSAVVHDLREGDLVEDGRPVPLDARIEHYAVAGTLRGAFAALTLGDGLVRVDSATAAIDDDHVGAFPGTAHLTLAHHAGVYDWIAARCGPPRAPVAEGPVSAERAPRSLGPYVALAADAVGAGATTVQTAHTSIAARPYDVLQAIAPLAPVAELVRDVHFSILRGTYASIRTASALVGGIAARRIGSTPAVPGADGHRSSG